MEVQDKIDLDKVTNKYTVFWGRFPSQNPCSHLQQDTFPFCLRPRAWVHRLLLIALVLVAPLIAADSEHGSEGFDTTIPELGRASSSFGRAKDPYDEVLPMFALVVPYVRTCYLNWIMKFLYNCAHLGALTVYCSVYTVVMYIM